MVARLGASMPAPLAMPPTDQPAGAAATAVLATESVVMIASAASGPPSAASAGRGLLDAGQQLVHRQPLADQAGRADRDVGGAESPAGAATCSAVAWVSAKPAGAGAGVGPAGVEHDRPHDAAGEHLLGPQHRRGLDPVGGEHPGGGVPRPVVDDQGHVGRAAGLEPGGDAGGPEAAGAVTLMARIPSAARPVVSGRPSIRLAHCTAWPAAPLPRLSIALTTMTRPGVGVQLGLQVHRVGAERGRGVRLPAVRQQVHERLAGVGLPQRPAHLLGGQPRRAGRAVTVARMPRGIGASTGVSDSVRAPVACWISGTCWCAPTL